MTKRKTQKDQTEDPHATNELMENRLVAFAEQLGSLVGTVHTRAEGWLDRAALTKEIARIRDNAAGLVARLSREDRSRRKPAAKRTPATATRASRGPVDAPGKRHRKPPPQERIDKRMGEPVGKKMGQKSAKNRGRGAR